MTDPHTEDDGDAGPEDGAGPAAGERVAKALAHAGIASRREAERLIEAGRISLNGVVLTSPAVKVRPGDVLAMDGQPVGARPPTRVWRYHKPAGLLTTHNDPQGRETVFSALPPSLGRVISVGRLDLNSEGLLLLTNDGELARVLELPRTGWTRRYRVRAFGKAEDALLARLAEGVTVDGVAYGPVEAVVDRRTGANVWLTIGLKEGKNREVRKVLASIGLTVNRLMRVAYGPFQLGALARGEAEEIKLSVLRDQMGNLYPLDRDGFPLEAGAEPKPEKTGTAKAKPRPVRPGGPKPGLKSGAAGKPAGKRPARGADARAEAGADARVDARANAGADKGSGKGPGKGAAKGTTKGSGKPKGRGPKERYETGELSSPKDHAHRRRRP